MNDEYRLEAHKLTHDLEQPKKGFTIICNACGLNYTFLEIGWGRAIDDTTNLKPNEMNVGMYKNKGGYMQGIECQCGNAIEEPE